MLRQSKFFPRLCRLRFMNNSSFAARTVHSNSEGKLYPDHIPTTPLQKSLLAIGSGIACFLHPQRPDLISLFGETSGTSAVKRMQSIMLSDPEGRHILDERPRIRSSTIDLEYLRKLPPNTFGRHYSDFLTNYHYSPDERMMVNFIDDVDLAYVMLRYREIHDLVHVLLNQPTNMLGEVVVKWVEGLQCSLPLGLFGGYFGALRLAPLQTKNYLSSQLEFALRVGLHSRNFMCVFFERYWELDIDEMRANLNVPTPPELKYKPRKKMTASPAT